MIQVGSFLNVIDNSGAKLVQCIRVITAHKAQYAKIGDTILVSVKKVRKRRRDPLKMTKGKIFKALILRVKVITKKISGNSYKFLENAAILMSKQNNKLVGTRVLGLITKEFRYTKFTRLLILSAGIV
jgi:large subunit ribosomal protein L14